MRDLEQLIAYALRVGDRPLADALLRTRARPKAARYPNPWRSQRLTERLAAWLSTAHAD